VTPLLSQGPLGCEDGGRMVLQDVGILPHCMASQPRRPWLEYSPQLQPQILCCFITSVC